MKSMVEVDVILDERYADPKVTIQTKSRTKQVENIIEAVENAADSAYPLLVGYMDDRVEFISQRDVVRIYTEKRRIIIQTDEKSYFTNKTLAVIEDMLNPNRFFRISQSEIVNMFKVRSFEFNIAGTIGVEMEDGTKTWVARSRVKAIKDMIKEGS